MREKLGLFGSSPSSRSDTRAGSISTALLWAPFGSCPRAFACRPGSAYEEGRESGDNDALDGLDDIKDTAVLDAGLFYDIGDLTLDFALEQDLLERGKGQLTFLGARYDIELLDDRLKVSPQADISLPPQSISGPNLDSHRKRLLRRSLMTIAPMPASNPMDLAQAWISS